ncbi:hypothetical protein GCM10007350_23220 [Jeongeupia chitinilytica]|uniref:Erythromycin esterase n=2 Tax=Jeongeupia chitinilytica TaxID=1041641 RepID=A0ABQ3H1R8_9NEIS|nr:hypothetical protein GCM10007350_23220 [Jeongeupia chitinilytica]
MALDADDRDLRELGRAIGDARFVVLCGQSHGEGNVFALQARISRYLHEHKGFNVLALGSGMYDLWHCWQDALAGKPAGHAVLGNLFFMYARATQLRPFFDYIEKQLRNGTPLELAGIDGPQGGAYSLKQLLAELAAFIEQAGQTDVLQSSRWPGFIRAAQRIIAREQPIIDNVDDIRDFQHVLATLTTWLDSHPDDVEAQLLSRSLVGLQAQLVELQVQDPRDWQIFENLQWLADTLRPDQKFVVWIHSMRGVPTGEDRLGDRLKRVYGNKSVFIAQFTGCQGRFHDYNHLGVMHTIPSAPPESWEHMWEKADLGDGYLIAPPEQDDERTPALAYRYLRYGTDEAAPLKRFPTPESETTAGLDALFVLRTIEPVEVMPY